MSEFELKVLTELRAIRELLEAREAGESSLLQVIFAHVRDLAFTANELLAHAQLPANRDLLAALADEFDVPNSRKVGKWLAAIAGRRVGNFTVEALGREREGVVWRIEHVSSLKYTSPVEGAGKGVMLMPRFGEGNRS